MDRSAFAGPSGSLDETARDFVFFKCDCIYLHKILQINYTIYDVQRKTDIIKPGMSCYNVMLLADHIASSDLTKLQHFLYGRILGAYHANVIYTGPGMQDYEARRFDFLWI